MYLLNGQRITDHSLWSENIVWEATSQIAGPAVRDLFSSAYFTLAVFYPDMAVPEYASPISFIRPQIAKA